MPIRRHIRPVCPTPSVYAPSHVTVAAGGEHEAGRVVNRAEQDRALFARYLDKRDPVDREMLVERFLPLARQLARRYQRPEEPFDDLFQVACLGLVKAIDRFDLEREVAFSSYAVPTILGEIKRYFRDRTWSVRVPRDLQELALKVDRAVSELALDLHRQPTVEEIGAKVGAEEEDVLEALEAVGRLPGDVARDPARQRGRRRRHARRHARRPRSTASRWPRTARRSSTSCARSRRASARCCGCASTRTSRRPRSASASASRRCRSRASSASRSRGCAPTPRRARGRRGLAARGSGLGAKTPTGVGGGTQLRTTAHLQASSSPARRRPRAAPGPGGRAAARSPSRPRPRSAGGGCPRRAARPRRRRRRAGRASRRRPRSARRGVQVGGHAEGRRGGGVEPRRLGVAQAARRARDAPTTVIGLDSSRPRRERGSTSWPRDVEGDRRRRARWCGAGSTSRPVVDGDAPGLAAELLGQQRERVEPARVALVAAAQLLDLALQRRPARRGPRARPRPRARPWRRAGGASGSEGRRNERRARDLARVAAPGRVLGLGRAARRREELLQRQHAGRVVEGGQRRRELLAGARGAGQACAGRR